MKVVFSLMKNIYIKNQSKNQKLSSSDLEILLSAALDRVKINYKNIKYVLASSVLSLRVNTKQLVLNKESIEKQQLIQRKKIAKEIINSFSPFVSLTVHLE